MIEKIGTRFRRAVDRFTAANQIPVVRFAKGERKVEVMRPHLDRVAATGRSAVAAVGVAQEFQRVWTASTRNSSGAPQFSYYTAERRVTCYYFYLWDADFGPAFVKVCAYFPYPAKIWINGHEWAKRQTPSAQGRHRFHRVVQRVRRHRRPGRSARHLRPTRASHHQRVL